MNAGHPAEFQREHGFTEADWLQCLPGAVGVHQLVLGAPGRATVHIGAGTLQLRWQVLPERRIALMRLPVLATQYLFGGVTDAERQAFMKFFDLYTQRGGG